MTVHHAPNTVRKQAGSNPVGYAKYRRLAIAGILCACFLLTWSALQSTWAQQDRASARQEAWQVLEEAAVSLQAMKPADIHAKYAQGSTPLVARDSALANDLAVHLLRSQSADSTRPHYQLVATWKNSSGAMERLAIQL